MCQTFPGFIPTSTIFMNMSPKPLPGSRVHSMNRRSRATLPGSKSSDTIYQLHDLGCIVELLYAQVLFCFLYLQRNLVGNMSQYRFIAWLLPISNTHSLQISYNKRTKNLVDGRDTSAYVTISNSHKGLIIQEALLAGDQHHRAFKGN